MQIGKIDFDRDEVRPGETVSAVVTFLENAQLASQISVGREWRIQEGLKLVATARITELLES